MNSTSSNKLTMQAQNYAASEAELLRSLPYSDLASTTKQTIGKSKFQQEITVSSETDYSSSVKQRDINVKVYHEDETHPRADISLTRYNAVQEVGGCQIATGTNSVSFTANGKYKSITVISSATFIPHDSGWTGTANYNIAVNGSSVGTFKCTSTTQKSGSKGHYWGTYESVTNQKTVETNISKGAQIAVNIASSSRHSFSTITVILGS